MKNKQILTLLLLVVCNTAFASSLLEGTWQINNSFGKKVRTVKVFQTSTGTLAAKVVKNLSPQKKCTKCTGRNKNKTIKGMVFVTGLTQVAGNPLKYDNAKIIDFRTGKTHKAEAKITNGDLYITDLQGTADQLWKRIN